jgi:hypothetical protein
VAKKRVLVQAGHLAPREPGIAGLGATGESQLVKRIRDRLVKLLEQDGRFDGIPVPGDIPDGISVDAALYLHADGFTDPTAGGFSFGFPVTPGNKKLVALIEDEFLKLPGHPKRRTDNGTADAAEYYAYRRVATNHEALVEHGFVSNPGEHTWLKNNVGNLAQAEYKALCKLFGLAPVGTRAPLEAVVFLAGDDSAAKLAKAAARASRSIGFKASTAQSADTIARLAVRAKQGQLGQNVAMVIGEGTEALLPDTVRAGLRDANGKWLPTRKSDLWDCTGEPGVARRKLQRRLDVLAKFEKKNQAQLVEAFRAEL